MDIDFEELLEKANKAVATIAAGRELVAEVLENVATAKAALTLHQKNEITALLASVTAESKALNDRIQHG